MAGNEIQVDARGRTSLAKVRTHQHDRYAVVEHPDGTLVCTPVAHVTVAELEALRGAGISHKEST